MKNHETEYQQLLFKNDSQQESLLLQKEANQKDIISLREQIKSSECNYKLLWNEKQTQEDDYNASIKVLEAKNEEVSNEINLVVKQNQDYVNRIQFLETNYNKTTSENLHSLEMIQKENKQLVTDNKNFKNVINDLSTTLKQKDDEIDNKQKLMFNSENTIKCLEEKNQKFKDTIKNLSTTVEQKNKETKDQQENISNLDILNK